MGPCQFPGLSCRPLAHSAILVHYKKFYVNLNPHSPSKKEFRAGIAQSLSFFKSAFPRCKEPSYQDCIFFQSHFHYKLPILVNLQWVPLVLLDLSSKSGLDLSSSTTCLSHLFSSSLLQLSMSLPFSLAALQVLSQAFVAQFSKALLLLII